LLVFPTRDIAHPSPFPQHGMGGSRQEKRGEFVALLKRAIEDNRRWPLSSQMKRWKGMLAKIDSPAAPRPTPYPQPKPSGTPSLLHRKLRGGGRHWR
jgi:hypothetical protein